MFGSLGVPEMLLILLVILVVFGGTRLPQLGRGLGEAIANFKAGLRNGNDKDKTPQPPEEKKN
jgi:sec-independent protein translocase protein TatA